MNLPESQMTEPLISWLMEQGYEAYCEVGWLSRFVDMVGWNQRDHIAIEMKMALTKKVIQQASVLQLATDTVYCATPTKPREYGFNRCKEYGIGILRVYGANINVILKADKKRSVTMAHHAFRLDGLTPGGIAGLPQLKGEGPAIDCLAAVRRYRTDHPTARWAEIFKAIPNHYANAGSFCSSMSKAIGREARKERNSHV